MTNTSTGLKIPLSSIVTKDFYVIPDSYATTDPQSGATGFMLATKTKSGKAATTFKSASIYASIEEKSSSGSSEDPVSNDYVDKSSFKEGDAIVNPDTGEKYVIGETDTLQGVYCINKGYAVFRCIEVLDQNEEYAIVAKNTSYGLSRYDHIVRNADQVKEQDILY